MVDLSQDVDAFMARNRELAEILAAGKTKAQKAEVIQSLKALIRSPEGPAHKAAMARLLEHMHQKNHTGHPSA